MYSQWIQLSILAVFNVNYMVLISYIRLHTAKRRLRNVYYSKNYDKKALDLYYRHFLSLQFLQHIYSRYIVIYQAKISCQFKYNNNARQQGTTVPYICTEDNQKYYVFLSRTRILLHEWIPVLFRVRISSNGWWFRAQMSDIEIFLLIIW